MTSTRTLRIGLLTHSVNPRGGVVHTLELGKALVEAGLDVTIFAPAQEGERMFRPSSCRVVLAVVNEAPINTIDMVDGRIRALKRVLRSNGAGEFDILHAQDSISGNALAEMKQSGEIRGFFRTVHHLDQFPEPQLSSWQRRAWKDADRVLCVSETWTRRMQGEFGVTALTVPNGVDTRRFSPVAEGDVELLRPFGIHRSSVVLAVGGIEERKNTLLLLEAVALLRKGGTDVQLVIAGGASLLDHNKYVSGFIRRASELGLGVGAGEAVVPTGALTDAAMSAFYRRADVLAMVSLQEGFGLAVLEALASGTPAVVSKIPPFTEYLNEAVCSWADPKDPVTIAKALLDALDARDSIDFVHAVPALLDRFSWSASARRHSQLYEQWLATQSIATQ
ncbi:MSMEG_0565 family glycosyltransferase [Paraburkholderia fungorum]|uniref:MSMEG_0565 family glycosyltransferase n=1 Tax=Paraburkholderia fungorum TaxID=134537 RepID=UPI0038BD8B57